MQTGCIFCDIVLGKIPADIIRQSDNLLVCKDIKPKAPVHLLIIPKKHIESIKDITEEDRMLVGDMIYMAQGVAEQKGLIGYQLNINVGREGGQIIDHLHLHVLGGWDKTHNI